MQSQFINADCLCPERGLPSIPSESVDLIPADPPYGIDFQSNHRKTAGTFQKIKNDDRPFTEWMSEAYRILKPGGRLMVFYRWDVARFFQDAAVEAGFNLVAELVWDKGNHGMGDLKAAPGLRHELFLYATKGRYEFTGKRPVSIIKAPRVHGDDMIHPNEKPETLYRSIYRDYTDGTGVIVDPFVGGGASLRCAQAMGFDFIGYELHPHYFQATMNRLAKGVQLDLL